MLLLASDEYLTSSKQSVHDFNFRRAEPIIIFAQWKQAAEC